MVLQTRLMQVYASSDCQATLYTQSQSQSHTTPYHSRHIIHLLYYTIYSTRLPAPQHRINPPARAAVSGSHSPMKLCISPSPSPSQRTSHQSKNTKNPFHWSNKPPTPPTHLVTDEKRLIFGEPRSLYPGICVFLFE